MTEANHPHVDQLFFSFSPGRGMSCTVSTLPELATQWWSDRLLPLSRLSAAAEDAPETSLSYFAFGDSNRAVMRRAPGAGDGRNIAHALVGSAEALTPRTALALTDWPGWGQHPFDDSAPVRPVLPAELPRGVKGLVPPARKMTTLLAALLRDREAKLAVTGASEEEKIPLLCGLHDLGTALWPRSKRLWTFSTYEPHEAGPKNTADVCFLPSDYPPFDSVTRLDAAPPDDGYHSVAAALVQLHLREELPRLAAVLADSPEAPTTALALQAVVDRLTQAVDPVVLARALRHAETPEDAAGVLGAMEEAGPQRSAAVRAKIRHVLLRPTFVTGVGGAPAPIDVIGGQLPVVYPTVAKVSLGDRLEDVADDEVLAALHDLLLTEDVSPGLVDALIGLAVATDRADRFTHVLGVLELRSRGARIDDRARRRA